MTYEEIIKMLERIAKLDAENYTIDFMKGVFEIIKRQQAEIERYKELEEQGRLMELPCQVGDKAWFIRNKEMLIETSVVKVIVKYGGMYLQLACNSMYETTCNSIGKTVFFSKEEAKAKLKEMKGE